ncbi:MAG: gamma-glutamylcyclotransferase family protein [Pseudomonadota bacterium]
MIVFVYGSLLNDKIRAIVFADTISNIRIESATAKNYATYCFPGESFPILKPTPNAITYGEVLYGLNDEAIARLAFFEGDEYALADIRVHLSDGKCINAKYNEAKDLALPACNQPWDFKQWQVQESVKFIHIVEQFMSRSWGKTDIKSASAIWDELRAQANND